MGVLWVFYRRYIIKFRTCRSWVFAVIAEGWFAVAVGFDIYYVLLIIGSIYSVSEEIKIIICMRCIIIIAAIVFTDIQCYTCTFSLSLEDTTARSSGSSISAHSLFSKSRANIFLSAVPLRAFSA